jgi:hypothetical protein
MQSLCCVRIDARSCRAVGCEAPCWLSSSLSLLVAVVALYSVLRLPRALLLPASGFLLRLPALYLRSVRLPCPLASVSLSVSVSVPESCFLLQLSALCLRSVRLSRSLASVSESSFRLSALCLRLALLEFLAVSVLLSVSMSVSEQLVPCFLL